MNVKLLERILSIQDVDVGNRARRDRSRKITVVGKYPRYLAQSLNLSELPKYDPENKIWRETASVADEGSRRHHELPAIIPDSRKTSRQVSSESSYNSERLHQRARPLRLPPIMLPPLYASKPTPLQMRNFQEPYIPRGPVTDEDWEDLKQCRYIRKGLKKFRGAAIS